MHEVSIILNVLEIAEKRCKEEGFERIDLIKLRIGTASGVFPDALLFAFEVSRNDTLAREASLVIEEVSLCGLCNSCGKEFEVRDKYVLSCLLCGSDDFSIIAGRELDIVELEVS